MTESERREMQAVIRLAVNEGMCDVIAKIDSKCSRHIESVRVEVKEEVCAALKEHVVTCDAAQSLKKGRWMISGASAILVIISGIGAWTASDLFSKLNAILLQLSK